MSKDTTLGKGSDSNESKGKDLLRDSFLTKEDPPKESVASFLVKEAPISKEAAKQVGKEVLQFHASQGNIICCWGKAFLIRDEILEV